MDIAKAMLATSFHEDGRLVLTPAMACMPGCPRFRKALYDHKTTAGEQHAVDFPESGVDVRPVVHGGDRPNDRSGVVLQRDCLSNAFDISQIRRMRGPKSGHAKHDRRWIDPHDHSTLLCRIPGSNPWAAPDVYDRLAGAQVAQAHCQSSVTLPAEGHAECSEQPGHTREPGVVGVVIGPCMRFGHVLTLTVEPGFKSSRCMSEALLTIGEVAARAHVATSTIRYYERRGLIVADARSSGQRRYRVATLRRLVFVGMLQDAGLSLTDISAILDAADISEWKAIAARRLEALDEEIATLRQARAYLAGALFCRFDHPATDCQVMGAEIDRRLVVDHEI